jgi:ABC-type multidrug transport system ATPase subunit
MGSVRTLANQNRTIVSTIHQPSPQTFALFDKLLLLGEGKVIYFGPLTGALSFFVNSPFQFQYTKGLNPADFIISVAGSFTSSGTGLKITASQLSEYYLGSSLYRQYEESKELMAALDIAAVNPLQNRNISIAKDGFENESGQRVNKLQVYSTSTWYQVKVLFRRVALKTIREPKLVVASLMRYIYHFLTTY